MTRLHGKRLFVKEAEAWGFLDGLDFQELVSEEGLADMTPQSRLRVTLQKITSLPLVVKDPNHLVSAGAPLIEPYFKL